MKTNPRKDDPSEVGQNFFYGISRKRNYRKAFPYLFEAANLGDIHCQNLVGYCYDLGLGVKRDRSQALFWYQRAARYHHKEALFNFALSYESGDGVKANPRKAFSYYKRAAELNDKRAQDNLGICYLDGVGTKQDEQKGIEWMRKSAQKEMPKPNTTLGWPTLMEKLCGSAAVSLESGLRRQLTSDISARRVLPTEPANKRLQLTAR